jgi:hypothetical protein
MNTDRADSISRRDLLARVGMGMGSLALGPVLAEALAGDQPDAARLAGAGPANAPPASAGSSSLSPKLAQFAPKAKRVIHLFMNGGPSHVDTFDPKPLLERYAGKPLPGGENLRTERKTGAAFPSPFKFRPRGRSGLEISDLFEHTARHADDLCVIRSMRADVPNHEPSLMLMNCGDARQVRPSLGSWTLYGLGTENRNLPGFVVMCPGGMPIAESQNWSNGFMPGIYQGTYLNPVRERLEDLIENVRPTRMSLPAQRRMLDFAQEMNRQHAGARPGDGALDSRIESLELAFRMQTEASDAFDVRREPAWIREAYGPGPFARQTLIARRLLERGVRFVQLWTGDGQPWDSHDDLRDRHTDLARQTDRPIGALLADLKRLGMLDDTLVIWGGEFGRTPTVELPQAGANAGKINGRDHNHYGFTMWLAGGGVKGGHVHGATDETGFKAVNKPVHVHDLHATILHLLGFDHERLTYRHAGRDYRLTDVHGHVVRELLA